MESVEDCSVRSVWTSWEGESHAPTVGRETPSISWIIEVIMAQYIVTLCCYTMKGNTAEVCCHAVNFMHESTKFEGGWVHWGKGGYNKCLKAS